MSGSLMLLAAKGNWLRRDSSQTLRLVLGKRNNNVQPLPDPVGRCLLCSCICSASKSKLVTAKTFFICIHFTPVKNFFFRVGGGVDTRPAGCTHLRKAARRHFAGTQHATAHSASSLFSTRENGTRRCFSSREGHG